MEIRPKANLSKANLSKANLRDANLRGADLREADLYGADLCRGDLRKANLYGADLSGTNLRGANLRGANLSKADMREADLSGADLREADLSGADLREAGLSGADLSGANLSETNLSGARGLSTQAHFLRCLERDELGIIAYKLIYQTYHTPPSHWTIKKGAYLTENCNPCRTTKCGCGVNIATQNWCNSKNAGIQLWKVRVRWEDVSDIVVPYDTDGKFRAARVELVERIK